MDMAASFLVRMLPTTVHTFNTRQLHEYNVNVFVKVDVYLSLSIGEK